MQSGFNPAHVVYDRRTSSHQRREALACEFLRSTANQQRELTQVVRRIERRSVRVGSQVNGELRRSINPSLAMEPHAHDSGGELDIET